MASGAHPPPRHDLVRICPPVKGQERSSIRRRATLDRIFILIHLFFRERSFRLLSVLSVSACGAISGQGIVSLVGFGAKPHLGIFLGGKTVFDL